MNPFSFATTAQILCESGSASQLGELCKVRDAHRVLIVTDPGITKIGLLSGVLPTLSSAGIAVEVFDQVEADPPESVVLAAVEQAKAMQAELIIGFGGGSSMDVAKLVALLAHPSCSQTLQDIYGVGNARGQRLPLIQVPTTAGTGSEVTQIAIITTGATTKMGVVSPILLPDLALLDADLTLGLPAHVTAATGIDAMVHAIEAYASASANNNPLSRMLATQALTLMGRSILKAVHEGSDTVARSEMLLGSMLAGQAFANSPVAAVHALAYPLGGHFHIPHGLSNALVLPHVLRFNVVTSPQPYAELAPYAFPELSKFEGQERAAAFCERLAELSRDCGLQPNLRAMNIPEDILPKLASDAMNQTRLLVNNPRPVTEADALAIYRDAF